MSDGSARRPGGRDGARRRCDRGRKAPSRAIALRSRPPREMSRDDQKICQFTVAKVTLPTTPQNGAKTPRSAGSTAANGDARSVPFARRTRRADGLDRRRRSAPLLARRRARRGRRGAVSRQLGLAVRRRRRALREPRRGEAMAREDGLAESVAERSCRAIIAAFADLRARRMAAAGRRGGGDEMIRRRRARGGTGRPARRALPSRSTSCGWRRSIPPPRRRSAGSPGPCRRSRR